MTRLLLGAAIGFTVGIVGAAALGLHAQDLDGVTVGTVEAANEAQVSVHELLGAMSTTGLGPRAYLLMTGELSAPVSEPSQAGGALGQPPSSSSVSRLLDCLAWHESRNTPRAYNARSGASGLLQFLPGTFASTPQGRAGLSIWDPVAQRQAGAWMIAAGRLHEWSTWRLCA